MKNTFNPVPKTMASYSSSMAERLTGSTGTLENDELTHTHRRTGPCESTAVCQARVVSLSSALPRISIESFRAGRWRWSVAAEWMIIILSSHP